MEEDDDTNAILIILERTLLPSYIKRETGWILFIKSKAKITGFENNNKTIV